MADKTTKKMEMKVMNKQKMVMKKVNSKLRAMTIRMTNILSHLPLVLPPPQHHLPLHLLATKNPKTAVNKKINLKLRKTHLSSMSQLVNESNLVLNLHVKKNLKNEDKTR